MNKSTSTIPLLSHGTGSTSQLQQQQQQQQQHHVVIMDNNNNNNRRRRPPSFERTMSVRDRWEEIGVGVSHRKYNNELLQKAAENEYDACEELLESKQEDVITQDEETKETALHLAAKNGQLLLMHLFLRHGADCNAKDNTGKSPLHLVATKDYLDCCQLLLNCSDIDVNIKNMNEDTPLHHAAREGRAQVCLTILEHADVQVNAQNKKGMTPLHTAAQEDHSTVIRLLLDKGANWKQRDKYSYMAIHYAALKGYPESCEALLSAQSSSEKEAQLKAALRDQKTPLMLAAKGGYHKCCTKLANANIDAQDKDGNTALYYACRGGFENTVTELLARGANSNIINKMGNTAILEAAGKKRVNCLKSLIEHSPNMTVVNKQGKTVLHQAAEKNAQESLLCLLDIPEAKKHLDSKDAESRTPLHTAIKREAVECAIILLEHGASPTEACKGGMTPLHLAADKGYTGICEKLLLCPKVNVSKENDNKATPLHLAALHGSTDLCQMLLRKGARVTAVDENGRTALHIASLKGYDSVVRFLAKKGVPQRAKDDTGNTALQLAASAGWLKSCQALVSCAKGLATEVDHNGKLPLDIAFEKKHDEVFEFLLAQLPFTKEEDRALRLHKYMHKALEENRLVAVEAIIDSEWWEAGFTGENGHHCLNLRLLLEDQPQLALKAHNKCIQRDHCVPTVTYDFRFFEDNYYIDGTNKTAKSPYDEKTKTVVKEAKPFLSDGLEWKRMHPVSLMVKHQRTALLHHPLTKAWLVEKWNLYISYIFLVLLFIELLFVISLTVFMANTDDWAHIARQCNMSRDEFCSDPVLAPGNLSAAEVTSLAKPNKCEGVDGNIGGYLFLFLMTSIILLVEGNNCYRLRKEYFSMDNSLKIVEVILTIILLVPLGGCEFYYQVLHEQQWQCGILALLLAWLLLISKLNQLPVFSVFMPITTNFIKSFIKVLSYILLLLGLFAYIFHLLLSDQSAFTNMPQAMVKTIVWLLGDLAYDDTFLNSDYPLVYPAMANFLFVMFVTTISGFIVNLFIAQPSEKLEDFRKRTAFHNAASQSNLVLQLDVCFPYFRKQRTRIVVTSKDHESIDSSILSRMLLKFYSTTEEGAELEDPLLKKLEEQHQHIATLVNLHAEHKEEIRDLKHQLNYIIRNMPGTTKPMEKF